VAGDRRPPVFPPGTTSPCRRICSFGHREAAPRWPTSRLHLPPHRAGTRIIGNTQCPNGTKAIDIYACYNINKLKPDGTKKSTAELSLELRAAIQAQKRQQNPNYGTFKNFGELFN